jgi:disulfide bond formation protein DsbB
MFKPCPSRWYYVCQFLLVAGLLAFAYYLELYQGLVPCAMCELQRLIFALLGILFFLGVLVPPRKGLQLLLNSLLALVALAGLIFAARQVWLQYHPWQVDSGSCEASLEYMLQVMSWKDTLMNIFLGGPECAKVNWEFLHLSIAGWSLLWFAAFFLLAVWQALGWMRSKS